MKGVVTYEESNANVFWSATEQPKFLHLLKKNATLQVIKWSIVEARHYFRS